MRRGLHWPLTAGGGAGSAPCHFTLYNPEMYSRTPSFTLATASPACMGHSPMHELFPCKVCDQHVGLQSGSPCWGCS